MADAGPLLPRLHKLVRSDCTTRNKRKAAALSGDAVLARGSLRRALGLLEAALRSQTGGGLSPAACVTERSVG